MDSLALYEYMNATHNRMSQLIFEAVAPALIMLLIGSLVFFCAEIAYAGQYIDRLRIILAWWVFGSVLVCRIAITDGRERSIIFGLALAAVVLLALIRFVEIRGPMSLLAIPMHLAFIVGSWWCASRLTWDCTVVNSSRDTTSRGLLSRLPWLGSNSVEAEEPITTADTNSDVFAATEDNLLTGGAIPGSRKPNLFKQIVRMGRKSNTPGLTIVYFSIAAVPIFGLGQGMIPAEDELGRVFAFKTFVSYMLAALGLLMTTSLLSLQQYLQRRGVAMPNSVALQWFATGTVAIVAILMAAWILPRPYPENSVAESPFKFDAPEDLESSRYAMIGNDGPDDDDDTSKVNQEREKTGKQVSKEGKEKSAQGRDDSESQRETSGGKNDGKSQGKSGEKKSAEKESEVKKSDSQQSDSKSKSKGEKSEQSAEEKNAEQQESSSESPESESNESNSEKESPQDDAGDSDESEQSDREKTSSENSNAESQESKQSDTEQDQSQEPEEKQQSGEPESEGSDNEQESESPQENQQSNDQQQADEPAAEKSASERMHLNPTFGALLTIMQWIFYLVAAIAGGWFAWKYRQRIAEAWLSFVQEIKDFINGLFGKRIAEATETEKFSESELSKLHSLHEFRDPFASGMSSQMTHEQIVRYSFAALEAWGNDNGCPRGEHQTPNEYAAQVAKIQPDLAAESQAVAAAYNRIMFANPDQIPGENSKLTRRFTKLWRKMHSLKANPNYEMFDSSTDQSVLLTKK